MQQLSDGRYRFDRRAFCKAAAAATAVGVADASLGGVLAHADLTKEQRDKMTADEIIQQMKTGNERFRSGKPQHRDLMYEVKATAKGQYPAAVILGCLDSRVPAEIVFDTGIGDTFIGRVAGNVVNDDLLGSMEFGCAVSGAKVIVVMGHTACGAIKGAIDDVELGNLTGLLARVKPAISATKFDGEKSSKNYAYVDTVAETNVRLTVAAIHRRSPILEDLSTKGTIAIVGAMYDLATGTVKFLG